jgi:hypothetical protein
MKFDPTLLTSIDDEVHGELESSASAKKMRHEGPVEEIMTDLQLSAGLLCSSIECCDCQELEWLMSWKQPQRHWNEQGLRYCYYDYQWLLHSQLNAEKKRQIDRAEWAGDAGHCHSYWVIDD